MTNEFEELNYLTAQAASSGTEVQGVVACPHCEGCGLMRGRKCGECHGSGRRTPHHATNATAIRRFIRNLRDLVK